MTFPSAIYSNVLYYKYILLDEIVDCSAMKRCSDSVVVIPATPITPPTMTIIPNRLKINITKPQRSVWYEAACSSRLVTTTSTTTTSSSSSSTTILLMD